MLVIYKDDNAVLQSSACVVYGIQGQKHHSNQHSLPHDH